MINYSLLTAEDVTKKVSKQVSLNEGRFIDRCLTALSTQTGYIVPQEYEIYHIGPGTRQQEKYTIKQ